MLQGVRCAHAELRPGRLHLQARPEPVSDWIGEGGRTMIFGAIALGLFALAVGAHGASLLWDAMWEDH